jgi:AbrB family looped-hinge helix DNA binding protein
MNEHLPGTKLAERLVTQPDGATMAEIIAATGGPQYNVLKRLEARGYRLRKVKEGNETRYFAEPPATPSCEATVTSKGQVTLPKEVRERLRLSDGAKVRFTFEDRDRVVLSRGGSKLSDLFGILGKPPRSLTLEEMDEVIQQAAVDRYRRAVGRKKR